MCTPVNCLQTTDTFNESLESRIKLNFGSYQTSIIQGTAFDLNKN